MTETSNASAVRPGMADELRRIVLSMPAAQLFGFDFSRIDAGLTELVLPYREALSFRPGFFAGAIVGSLADFAGASCAYTLMPAGWMTSTIDYDVKVIAPAQGEKLIARGSVIKHGLTLTFARAEVFVMKANVETLCGVAFVTTRNFELK